MNTATLTGSHRIGSGLIATWLVVSPFALGFADETHVAAITQCAGLLLFAIALQAFPKRTFYGHWFHAGIGLWLIVGPWELDVSSARAQANAVVAGLVVLTWGLAGLRDVKAEVLEADRAANDGQARASGAAPLREQSQLK